jgi:hypothetical protein
MNESFKVTPPSLLITSIGGNQGGSFKFGYFGKRTFG